jgi:hypothetical protein
VDDQSLTAGVYSCSRTTPYAAHVGLESTEDPWAVRMCPMPSGQRRVRHYAWRQSALGMMRLMNSSNIGTVYAVSPWFGLQIIPLAISELRVGASDVTLAG